MSAKYDVKELGELVLSRLKEESRNREGKVYADLSGRVFDAREYAEALESDVEFAKEQVELALSLPPVPTEPGAEEVTLTPREQTLLANQVVLFARNNPDLEEGVLLEEFARRRPVLSSSLNVEDWEKVAETLQFENNMKQVQPPSQGCLEAIGRELAES